jgi:hypothetical protein
MKHIKTDFEVGDLMVSGTRHNISDKFLIDNQWMLCLSSWKLEKKISVILICPFL